MTFWRLSVSKQLKVRSKHRPHSAADMEDGGQRVCRSGIDHHDLVEGDKTTPHSETKTRTKRIGDKRRWSVGHPGVGEVYHLSLLCGEAWMDSSCQTSIYRAAWRNSPPRPGRTPALQGPLRTASLHSWTSPGTREHKILKTYKATDCRHVISHKPPLWDLDAKPSA